MKVSSYRWPKAKEQSQVMEASSGPTGGPAGPAVRHGAVERGLLMAHVHNPVVLDPVGIRFGFFGGHRVVVLVNGGHVLTRGVGQDVGQRHGDTSHGRAGDIRRAIHLASPFNVSGRVSQAATTGEYLLRPKPNHRVVFAKL